MKSRTRPALEASLVTAMACELQTERLHAQLHVIPFDNPVQLAKVVVEVVLLLHLLSYCLLINANQLRNKSTI